MIHTLPNSHPEIRTRSRHIIPIHGLCPISRNPQPGSTIAIIYRPRRVVLEVYSLTAYIRRYIGGFRDAAGQIVIRDMEQTIQQIAIDAAQALGAPAHVLADLILDAHPMQIACSANPAINQTPIIHAGRAAL